MDSTRSVILFEDFLKEIPLHVVLLRFFLKKKQKTRQLVTYYSYCIILSGVFSLQYTHHSILLIAEPIGATNFNQTPLESQ